MGSVDKSDQHNHLGPTTSKSPALLSQQPVPQVETAIDNHKNYQVKCNLLEYHIHEAILINKALRSELKQYKDKIEFEKRLKKFLVARIKGPDS